MASEVTIGIGSNNWYLKKQLVLEVTIGIGSNNWYLK
jgi:hypothetical protein